MRDIHKGLPYKVFPRPQSGLASVNVCAVSGLLPTDYCNEGTVNLLYLEGTQPTAFCDIHKDSSQGALDLLSKISSTNALPTPIDKPTQNENPLTIPNLDSSIKVDLPGLQ